MKRRQLLAAMATSTSVTAAGCSSGSDNQPIQLGMYVVHNHHLDTSHQYDLEVIRDGDSVHYSSHNVQSADQYEDGGTHAHAAVAECDWGDAMGDYAVKVRVDESEWIERSVNEFAESSDVGCILVQVSHEGDQENSFRFTPYQGCDRDFEYRCSFTKE